MKIVTRLSVGLIMGAALVGFAASPLRAGVVLTGDIILINAPTSDVQSVDPQNNNHAFIWSERSGLVLPKNLSVDMTQTGTADNGNNYRPSPGTIAAGTLVDTYLLHSDPRGASAQNYQGSITFDSPILGIIDTRARLAASDAALGYPGEAYPGLSTDRGLEGRDSFGWVSNDGLTFNFNTSTYVDEVRIIVATPVVATVPEPSTVIAGLSGAAVLLGLSWFRKRRGQLSTNAA